MNFIEELNKGQKGENRGIPLGPGLANVSRIINGLQKEKIYGIAAPSKTGKSTFVNYAFLIQPYLYAIENNIDIKWIYYSFEISRVSIEFDVATYFLWHDYDIETINLPQGIEVNGKRTIQLSPDYLRGRILDDEDNVVKIDKDIFDLIGKVYFSRIVPMFGVYSPTGILLEPGMVDVIEEKDNPTGLYKYLLEYARQNGKFITQKYGNKDRIMSYQPKNPERYVVIITDHLRKLIRERGFDMKTNVDKFIEYSVELRNKCKFTFVHIIHTNRNLASENRLRFAGDQLYPTSEDIKDTGNLTEEGDHIFTLFNPNDDRYRLKKHFGYELRDRNNNILNPNLRTLHLVESRWKPYPQHFKIEMLGGIKTFKQI